ncbi:MAG: hypothetical protein ACTHM0_00195 [Sphingomonas sp.]
MPITRTLTEAFDCFGARAANVRWGWAAQNPVDGTIVVTMWADQIRRDGATLLYSTGPKADLDQWVRRPGNADRKKKLQYALDHCGGRFRAVIVEAVDPAAGTRATKKRYRADLDLVMQIDSFDPATGEFSAHSI